MSSLSFLPRKLTKGVNAQKSSARSTQTIQTDTPGESVSIIHSAASGVTPNDPASSSSGTVLLEFDDQDYTNLLSLSLSDFMLWLDVELRRKLGHDPTQGSDTSCESVYSFDASKP